MPGLEGTVAMVEAQPINFAALNQSGRSAAMAHASTACGRGSAGVARVTLSAGPTAGQVENMAKSFLQQYYSGRGVLAPSRCHAVRWAPSWRPAAPMAARGGTS